MSDLRDDAGITAAALAVLKRLHSSVNPVSDRSEPSHGTRRLKGRRGNEIIPGLSADAEIGRKLVNAFKALPGDYRSAYLAEHFPTEGRRSSRPGGKKGLPEEVVRIFGEQTGFTAQQINAGIAIYDRTDMHDRNHETLRIDFWERMGRAINAAADPRFSGVVENLNACLEEQPQPGKRSGGMPRAAVPAGRPYAL